MVTHGSLGVMQFLRSLQPLSEEAAQKLEELMTEERVPANHTLQATNSRCNTIYFMQTGAARIYYYKEARDVTEHFALAPAMIIRAESLFTGSATKKGIEVLVPSQVVSIPGEAFFRLASQHLEIERLFHLLIRASYLESLERLEQLQFQSAKERYELLLASAPEVVLKLPLKHIASFLGIAQASLSRIRAQIR